MDEHPGRKTIRRTGFTIIELTVAILVAVVGISAASVVIVQSGHIMKLHVWQAHAPAVAEQALLRLRSMPLVELLKDGEPKSAEVAIDTTGDGQGDHVYKWRAEVKSAGPSLATVTVIVSWSDVLGAHELKSSTLIADRGGR